MKIQEKYQVIVAGAGIAGVSAAVAAGRQGASVLLIEHYAFVGGMSTAGMVSPFMKHAVEGKPLVNGVFADLEETMRLHGGMIDNGFYAHAFRSAAYELLQRANVTVLYRSEIAQVMRTGQRITAIGVLSEGREVLIQGDVFIDTTGDAQLVCEGNFAWNKGDEQSGKLQAMTLFFRMGGIDIQRAAAYTVSHPEDFFQWMDFNFDFSKIISIAGYFSNVQRAILEKRLSPDIQYIFYTTLPGSGEASFNTSNILGLDGSTSMDLTRAELIGRTQVAEVVSLLQQEIPGFENAYLLETAVQVGVRETRRAVGDYLINGNDIKEGRKFPHPVARGCYGIDIHGQKGEESRMEDLPEGQYYEIPLESLRVSDADNLLVAGRCISATREGHSALRIMPTSAATGEACGALAALASQSGTLVRNVPYGQLRQLIQHNITF